MQFKIRNLLPAKSSAFKNSDQKRVASSGKPDRRNGSKVQRELWTRVLLETLIPNARSLEITVTKLESGCIVYYNIHRFIIEQTVSLLRIPVCLTYNVYDPDSPYINGQNTAFRYQKKKRATSPLQNNLSDFDKRRYPGYQLILR